MGFCGEGRINHDWLDHALGSPGQSPPLASGGGCLKIISDGAGLEMVASNLGIRPARAEALAGQPLPNGRVLSLSIGTDQHMQQQIGVLLRHMQQEQPAFIMVIMQSQHSWIILQHCVSPLVQVMQTPFFIISHLHMPMVMLKQAIIIPLFIMQQLIMLPAIIWHMFCSMAAAMESSLLHIIFMPPSHFSIFIMQRGTIIMFIVGMLGMVMGFIIGAGIMERSIVIIFFMVVLLSFSHFIWGQEKMRIYVS
jgi:hypothetical protein